MKIAGKNFDSNLKMMKGHQSYQLDKKYAGMRAGKTEKKVGGGGHYKSSAKNGIKMLLAKDCLKEPQTRTVTCLRPISSYQVGKVYTITIESREVAVERTYSQWGRAVEKTEKKNVPFISSPTPTQLSSWNELFEHFKFYRKEE